MMERCCKIGKKVDFFDTSTTRKYIWLKPRKSHKSSLQFIWVVVSPVMILYKKSTGTALSIETEPIVIFWIISLLGFRKGWYVHKPPWATVQPSKILRFINSIHLWYCSSTEVRFVETFLPEFPQNQKTSCKNASTFLQLKWKMFQDWVDLFYLCTYIILNKSKCLKTLFDWFQFLTTVNCVYFLVLTNSDILRG